MAWSAPALIMEDSAPRRSRWKLALDLVMAITFALLLNTRVLGGLPFHEVAGTLIGFVFALHVYLNWNWVVQTTLRYRRASLPPKIKLGYQLNALLLLAMGIILVSGLLISRVAFPGLRVPNARWIQAVHITLAFLILSVVGVHVGLHWNWIVLTVRRIRPAVLAAVLVALLAAGGIEAYRIRSTPSPSPVQSQAAKPTDSGPASGSARPEVREGDPGHRDPRHGRGRGDGGRRGRSSALATAAFYLGILSLFAGGTVLIERWVERNRPVPAG